MKTTKYFYFYTKITCILFLWSLLLAENNCNKIDRFLFLLTFQLSAKLLIEIVFDVVIIPIVFPNIDFVFILFAIGPFCYQIERLKTQN